MASHGRLEVWEGADGLWRWRYRGPGGRPVLLSSRVHLGIDSALVAARTAFPGTTVEVRRGVTPGGRESSTARPSAAPVSPAARAVQVGGNVIAVAALVVGKTVADLDRLRSREWRLGSGRRRVRRPGPPLDPP